MDPVTLIAPDGTQYVTSDPVEANNLQFGHGYRPYDAGGQLPTGHSMALNRTAQPEAVLTETTTQQPTTRGRRTSSDRESPAAE